MNNNKIVVTKQIVGLKPSENKEIYLWPYDVIKIRNFINQGIYEP